MPCDALQSRGQDSLLSATLKMPLLRASLSAAGADMPLPSSDLLTATGGGMGAGVLGATGMRQSYNYSSTAGGVPQGGSNGVFFCFGYHLC